MRPPLGNVRSFYRGVEKIKNRDGTNDTRKQTVIAKVDGLDEVDGVEERPPGVEDADETDNKSKARNEAIATPTDRDPSLPSTPESHESNASNVIQRLPHNADNKQVYDSTNDLTVAALAETPVKTVVALDTRETAAGGNSARKGSTIGGDEADCLGQGEHGSEVKERPGSGRSRLVSAVHRPRLASESGRQLTDQVRTEGWRDCI